MTSDPIGLDGGLNTYGYVGGNPLLLVDRLGLEATGEWIESPSRGGLEVSFSCSGEGCISLSSPELMVMNIQGTAKLTWKVRCTEEDCYEDRQWDINGSVTFRGGRSVAVPLPLCMLPLGPKYKKACIAAVTAALLIRVPKVKKEVIQDIYDQADLYLQVFHQVYDPNVLCNQPILRK